MSEKKAKFHNLRAEKGGEKRLHKGKAKNTVLMQEVRSSTHYQRPNKEGES